MQPDALKFSLKLPSKYRSREVTAFHARDPQPLAEQAETERIRKGFMLDGIPISLEIALRPERAECRAELDGELTDITRATLRRIAGNLLGLHIDPTLFETVAREDKLFQPLILKQSGLRIPQSATAFEALTWAIIGQQINLSFAIALRRTFIQLAGQQHSSGLWCYPDAATVARIDPKDLAKNKFSRAKAETLVRAAKLTASGEVSLDQKHSTEKIETALLAIKGIGPWTVNYTLLRGLGFADCSLHGDAAVRVALHRLTESESRPTLEESQILLERYKPHRSLAAAHLWASLK